MKEKKIVIRGSGRLFDLISQHLKDLSGKKIKSFIKYKMVEVDGHIITNPNTILKENSEVVVYFTKRVIDSFELNVIYEDKDLIVIDKPAGLLSISNSKEKEITAFRLVSEHIKKEGKHQKLFVVHRLDQGTSGVLLFSKNQKLKETLQKTWNDIVKKREYIAVVEGEMKPNSGTIKSYLAMNHFQKVYSTKSRDGWLAITHYKTLCYKNRYSMLQVDIDTGRRNQIRVHMSEAGHPVTGDKKYGAKKNPINRLALHASKLHLIDPRNGKLLKLESQVPEDIRHLVD